MQVNEIIDDFEFGRLEQADELFRELQTVIHDRFVIEGYISPTPNRQIEDEYISSSVYFYARNLTSNRIIGGFRMILPQHDQILPIQKEFQLSPSVQKEISLLAPEEYVEIGRLAILPGYNVAECLYRQGWQFSRAEGHKTWTISADKRLWALFRRFRGLMFRQAGESQEYLGSTTIPGIATLDELAHSMKERTPRFFCYMTDSTPPLYLYASL